MRTTKVALKIFLVITIILISGQALSAQEYPTHPITMVNPFGVGGMVGVSGRILAKGIEDILGQPINMVNWPGAGGTVATRKFIREKPDGYTVMVTSITPFSAPFFQGFLPYDMEKDFKYVGGFMPQERLLVVRKDEPYSKSWKDLIKYAKEHPKGLSCGASGSVSSMEVIKSITVVEGIKFKYVLFQNASPALMGGHIDICEAGVGTPAYQGAKKGTLKAVLNIGGGKVPGMPEVPNIHDFNYPFQTYRYYGFIFQGNVPENIRQKWENALQEVLKDPDIRQKMEKLGFQIQFKNGKEYKEICKEYVESRVELLKFNKKHFKY